MAWKRLENVRPAGQRRSVQDADLFGRDAHLPTERGLLRRGAQQTQFVEAPVGPVDVAPGHLPGADALPNGRLPVRGKLGRGFFGAKQHGGLLSGAGQVGFGDIIQYNET